MTVPRTTEFYPVTHLNNSLPRKGRGRETERGGGSCIMPGRNVAVVVFALLLTSTAVMVSSFLQSSRSRMMPLLVKRRNSLSRSSSRINYRKHELTCGLQITVRIRGKKSREQDYTNQVRDGGVVLMLPHTLHVLCALRT